MDNVIKAYFYSGNIARTNTVFQYNRGMILKFMDVDLPATYRVDFANSLTGQSKTCVGTADGVIVPLEMMAKGCTVYAWAVIANEDSTVTEYQAMIPISPRAEPTDEAPNPEQQQVIDQLIAAMNQAVEQTGADVESADAAAAAAAASAQDAAASEAAASASEQAAKASETAAAGSASSASADAATASSAASTATQQAGIATSGAEAAAQKAADAAASEQAAASSETAAAGSASSASADAATAASAASTATQQAGIATSGAETATQKAADAAASAQDAASSETAAAGSVAAAATSETNAGAAATAAQTAKAAAEAAAQSVSESAAQIETNKEDIADLKSAFTECIASSALCNRGFSLSGTGAYVNSTVFETSDVEEGKKYTLSIDSVSGATAQSAYGYLQAFDASDTMLGQAGLGVTAPIKTTLTAPVGTKKLKIYLVAASGTALPTGTAVFSGVKLYEGDSIVYSYKDDIKYDRLADVETVIDASTSDNLFFGDFENANISTITGVYTQLSSGVSYAAEEEYIPVEASGTYAITCITKREYVAFYVFEYDSSKTFLTSSNFMFRKQGHITVSASTAYIRMQIYVYGVQIADLLPSFTAVTKGLSIGLLTNAKTIGADALPLGGVERETFKPSDNLFTGMYVNAAINNSGVIGMNNDTTKGYSAEAAYIPVSASTDYRAVFDRRDVDSNFYINKYDASGAYVSKSTLTIPAGATSAAFTTDSDTGYVRFQWYASGVAFDDLTPTRFALFKTHASRNYVNPYSVEVDAIDAKKLLDANAKALVPNYYHVGKYLDGKVATIRNLIRGCSSNGDIFIFITDEHWSQNAQHSPALIRYLSQELNIPRLFSGGDMGEPNDFGFAERIRMAYDAETHYVMGNHDVRSDSNILYYEYDIMNNDQIGNATRHYYYVDNVQQKIRYVVLSAYEYGEAVGYEAEQLAWLTATALNVDVGWTIIVFTHVTYFINYNTDALEQVIPQTYLDALDNYSGNGTIACIISGHTHRDRVTATTGGIPIVITTCDKYVPYVIGSVQDLNVTRELGTITEQAFDVVVLDKTSKKLTFVRIGAQALNGVGDNPGTAVEYREVTYGS